MTEVQPAEGQTNGGGGGGGGGPVVVAASTDQQIGTKRQRRPSVRLGDIGGDQSTYDSTHALNRSTSRSSNKPHWKQHRDKSSSKSRTPGGPIEFREILDKEPNLDTVAIGSWKVRDSSKSKRSSIPTTKRIRSNWVSKIDGNGQGDEEEVVGGEEEDVGDEFRVSDSESPVKDNSPVHSSDNNEREGGRFRRGISTARVLDGGVELDGPSDNDGRNWNNNSDVERNGVKVWLNQLGLGRYAPIFEIHEVDDEVLPMLTLEDLKDMGINAVGSRRKMYSSIQKLGKGFS